MHSQGSIQLLGAFASVARLIAALGVYCVLAYSVCQRRQESGVRIALRLIVGEGMKLVLIGIGSGLLAGLALGRTLSSLVFGVPVRDPVTFVTVAGTLAILALAACATPGLRGSRITPSPALRCE